MRFVHAIGISEFCLAFPLLLLREVLPENERTKLLATLRQNRTPFSMGLFRMTTLPAQARGPRLAAGN